MLRIYLNSYRSTYKCVRGAVTISTLPGGRNGSKSYRGPDFSGRAHLHLLSHDSRNRQRRIERPARGTQPQTTLFFVHDCFCPHSHNRAQGWKHDHQSGIRRRVSRHHRVKTGGQTLLLTEEQSRTMLVQFTCSECKHTVERVYCRDHDEFAESGHRNGCNSVLGAEHLNHRLQRAGDNRRALLGF